MTSDTAKTRRRYGKDLKARVIAECQAAGASVAKIAMSHGINANVVHRWRQLARGDAQVSVAKPQEFVAVALAAPAPDGGRQDIEIELRRGSVTMRVLWPTSAAGEFATWTRELLR